MADNKIILPIGSNNTSISDDASGSDDGGKPFVETVDLGTSSADVEAAAIAKAAADAAAAAADDGGTETAEELAAKAAAEEAAAIAAAAAADDGSGAGETSVSEVEIEGVVYQLDDNGNAINAENQIAFTQEVLAGMESDDEAQTGFALGELSSINPVDNEGNQIQYEDNDEGRRRYIEDVYEAGAIDRANQIVDERMSRNPLIKTVTDYIIANGSLDGYDKQSYTRTAIKDDSPEEELIATIRTARKMKGDTEVEIANAVTWAKSDNKLLDLAKTSDAYLHQYEKAESDRIAADAKLVETRNIERNREYVSNLSRVVQDGNFEVGGKKLVIPAIINVKTEDGNRIANRDELIKYATQVNQYKMPDGSLQNATQYQIDKYVKSTTRDINDDIFEMFALFTGGDNSQLIQSAINNDKSNTIRKRLKMKRATDRQTPNTGTPKLKLKYNK